MSAHLLCVVFISIQSFGEPVPAILLLSHPFGNPNDAVVALSHSCVDPNDTVFTLLRPCVDPNDAVFTLLQPYVDPNDTVVTLTPPCRNPVDSVGKFMKIFIKSATQSFYIKIFSMPQRLGRCIVEVLLCFSDSVVLYKIFYNK